MAGDSAAQAAWLKQFLNFDFPSVGATDGGRGAKEKVTELSLKRLATCRLIWVKTVGSVHTQAQALKAMVMEACRSSGAYTDEQLGMIETALQNIDNMVSGVDESLVDMVDAVINAEQGPPRVAAQRAAMAKTDELVQYVSTDEDFGLIDQNEYMATNVRATTLAGLNAIRKELTGAS